MGIETLVESDKRLALGIYRLHQLLGELSQLNVQNKTTLVAAINEVLASVGSAGVSEERVNTLISGKLAEITGGASAAYDTLKEIEDLMKKGDTTAASILSEIAALKQKDQDFTTALTLDAGWPAKVDRLMTTGAE